MKALLLVGLAALALAGCNSGGASTGEHTFTFAGFAVSREAYQDGLIPAFQADFEKSHPGQTLAIRQSYDGSGAQLRAIENGLRADAAGLALAPEIDKLAEKKLADAKWSQNPAAFPAYSLVVFAVRKGNPKHIADWKDLERDDVSIVSPDPDTSGAAKWNVAAVYGAAKLEGRDPIAAVTRFKSRVAAFGKSGREAMQQFAGGTGDVLITWELEAKRRQAEDNSLEIVYPPKTLKMTPPVAAISGSKTGNAFLQFLATPAARTIFTKNYFRTEPDPNLNLFTVEDLGGWPELNANLFGEKGIWAAR